MLSHVHKPELHFFRHQRRWYCLDVARGRFGPVSSLEQEILALPEGTAISQTVQRLGKGRSREAIQQALADLERRRLLLDGPRIAETSWSPGPRRITRLVLNVAEKCNLRCQYCSAGEGCFNDQGTLMSRETALRGVDFLLDASDDSPYCRIQFFGGEPLLNFEVIRQTVEYGQVAARRRSKQLAYRISSNITLLTEEHVALFKRAGMTVTVSLDGPAEIHDRMRRFPNGAGSYRAVVSRLPLLLADYADNVHASTTMTHYQTGAVSIVKHLTGLGFRNIGISHMMGQGEGDFQTGAARRRLKAAYSRLGHHFLAGAVRGDFSAGSPFLPFLLHFCSGQQRRAFCEAGRRMLGLSADGGLYLCHFSAQLPEYQVGDVWAGLDEGKLDRLVETNVDKKAVCGHCWARYICGGGCLYLAAKCNGDARLPWAVECELIRHVIQVSIWIHSELREKAPEAFVELMLAEGRAVIGDR